MRVLIIDVNCKYSSTGKIVLNLYEYLNNHSIETAICYGRGPRISKKNIFRIASPLEVLIHAFLARLTGLNGYFSPFSTARLLRVIKKFKPNVVHLHELHGYYVNYGLIIKYLKRNRIKTIWTFHCEYMYTGKCGHANQCEKWKTECNKCPQLRVYPKSLMFDFTRLMFRYKKKLMEDFDCVIVTPSVWLSNRVKNSFLQNKKNVVVRNSINIDLYSPRDVEDLIKMHGLEHKIIVLALAPNLMSAQKGGEWVLKAANSCSGEQVMFVMIGIDDMDKWKFPGNVIAMPRIYDQNLLAKYYSLADIFLICSEKENFPTTCLEALACGTPVVGFNTGGTAETVPEPYGKFYEYGDIESLINYIKTMKHKTIDIIGGCRKFAIEHYSNASMGEKYLKLYQDGLEK